MGIYIPGTSMPKCGEAFIIYADGDVRGFLGSEVGTVGTAVELPPHGRCIDADAFNRNIANLGMKYDPFMAAGVIAFVNDAPTIIPAEEE